MPLSPDDQVSAAELALGLVNGGERAVLLRRTLADQEFASAVEEWRTAFAALLVFYPEAEPPKELQWKLAALGADARPWRWAAAVASVAAAGLGCLLLVRATPAPVGLPPLSPITYAAAMTPADEQRGKAFAALFDSSAGQVRLPISVDAPRDRVAQLWRIGADGIPHSLGVLIGTGTITIALNARDRTALAAGATLAVSIEPQGGSPKTVPTGPVVATGALTRL